MSFRFRPPAVPPSATAVWVLDRAFGPVPPAVSRCSAGNEALVWSKALGLTERCADRLGETGVGNELEPETAREFLAARHRAAAGAILLRQLAAKTASVAEELAVPLVLLKGMALLESGVTNYGARPMCDIDVLVPAALARELAAALCQRGFHDSGVTGPDFHLPPLLHSGLGTLEIHSRFRDLPGGLTAEQLAREGLAVKAPEMPGALLPAPGVLAAHAVAHALEQHGMAPASYPLLRALADVQDLCDQHRGPVQLIAENPYLDGALSARERSASTTLLLDLTAGRRPAGGSDAQSLLHHALAAASDTGYRSSLRTRAAVAAVRRRDWRRISRGLGRAVGLVRPRPARAGEAER